MTDFNLLAQPIGRNVRLLLEASAGTGKTFNIANLYLRLVLEGAAVGNEPDKWSSLEVADILVVTYTRLATAELIERIRSLLAETLQLVEADCWNPDDFPGRVIEHAVGRGGKAERASRLQMVRLRLRAALTGFDQAAIMTIHGFCSRMLNEFAFESGEPFNLELVQDDARLIEEAVAAFWRRHFYPTGTELLSCLAAERGITFSGLCELARQVLPSPELRISCGGEESGLTAARQHFAAALERFRAAWRPELVGQVRAYTFKKGVSPEALLDDLERIVVGREVFGGMFGVLQAYTTAAFTGAINRRTCRTNPDGALAVLLAAGDDVAAAVAGLTAALRGDFIRYLREERPLDALKSEMKIRTYNDLLLDLRAALFGSSGERLTERIRSRFKVAMIDEFQDTDPLQYEIFTRLFAHSDGMLMMVGDPKQSIYSFRGADIYAYLQVKSGLRRDETPTLQQNYRSVPRLIGAVNRLFDLPYSFAEQEITFVPVTSGRDQRRLVIDGVDSGEQPLRAWFLRSDGGGTLTVPAAEREVVGATATTIAGLLTGAKQGRTGFVAADGAIEPLRAADIAILVNKHSQAFKLKQELTRRGVNAVMQGTRNVFASPEARDFFLVVNAVAAPGNMRAVKSALVTPLLRVPPEEVSRYGREEEALADFEFWLDRFSSWRRAWEREGFMAMFNRLMAPEKGCPPDTLFHKDVRLNLVGFPDGERRLTNILQLAELTHQAIRDNRFGMAAAIEWLRANVNQPENAEEQEQRLESDEAAVKILTVFKSKGLQFPVVFCPFVWEKAFSRRDSGRLPIWHRRDSGGNWNRHLSLDGADDAAITRQCRRELLAEKLRLLYVALTRAVNCCWIATGEINQAGDAALTFLQRRDWNEQSITAYLDDPKMLSPDPGQLDAIWSGDVSGSPLLLQPLPDVLSTEVGSAADSAVLTPPEWPPGWRIPRHSGVMSFTALSSGEHHAVEASPDLDDPVPAAEKDEVFESLPVGGLAPFASFPRGAVSGDCIHRIFERFDFSRVKTPGWAAAADTVTLLESQMRLFGRSLAFESGGVNRLAQLAAMLGQVLTTPLPAADGAFRLCDLEPVDRIAEMNFFFRVADDIMLPRLAALVREQGLAGYRREYGALLERLAPSFECSGPLRGYMTGKIDLFFRHDGRYYLLDWKSNHLGERYLDYRPERLLESMFASSYVLQYLIYTLAADKYLRRCLPDYDYDTHFGGVYYLYVRGMNGGDAGTGVFFDRPDRALVAALAEVFPERKEAIDE